MAADSDVPLLQWALGGVSAALTAGFSWLWNRLSALETRTDAQMRDLWNTVTDDRKTAQASRERMLERLGEMPTKADLQRLDDKLNALLAHRNGSD